MTRRLEGDPEALRECSLGELRQVVADMERGAARAREELTQAQSRAAGAEGAENATCCGVCMTHPRDTALNCGCVHRLTCLSYLFPYLFFQ